jgi:hypothetical protein
VDMGSLIFNISLSGAPPSALQHQPPTQNLIEKAGLGELFACDVSRKK